MWIISGREFLVSASDHCHYRTNAFVVTVTDTKKDKEQCYNTSLGKKKLTFPCPLPFSN